MIHINALIPRCPIKFLAFKNCISNIILIAYTLKDLVIDMFSLFYLIFNY